LKNFFNPGPFARSVAVAALSRLGTCWRSRVRVTALVLLVALFANSLGQESAAQRKPRAALSTNQTVTVGVTSFVAVVSLIGFGVYAIIQQAHTVKGCVSDSPDGLQFHTQDGKTFVLLGNTTNIKANTKIKVTGKKRKKIGGITDQPSFVVEKLDKSYGPCSVSPVAP
jgi:hypothetical protein